MVSIDKIIAVIPARGGSTRIPLKPLRKINDCSLLERTISLAIKSSIFDDIIVSTDDKGIAAEAKSLGANVPFLRTEFADDFSPVSLATIWTLEKASENNRLASNDCVIQLLPTCPFFTQETLKKMLEQFLVSTASPLLSCTRADPLTRYAFEMDAARKRRNILKTDIHSRTQDHKPTFLPSGAAWMAMYKTLMYERTFMTANARYWEISTYEGYDIDSLEQIEFAEAWEKIHGQSH